MAASAKAVLRHTAFALQKRTYSAPATRAIPAAKQKYVPSSGTYPKGFLAGTSHAGVKESNTQYDDVTLVVSKEPCSAAAVFTQNMFRAAPIEVSRKTLSSNEKHIKGVVINSGCANAVTGALGLKNAERMAKAADGCFSLDSLIPSTLVMSTGVIGQQLPIERIEKAIPTAHANLGDSHDHWLKAAQAICTTDTFPKLISRQFTLPSDSKTTYTITGMTKGAGMIHPNMATLLGVICTDVRVAEDELKPLLTAAIETSFNRISIDGDTSTNDTVALLANGAAAPANSQPISTKNDRIDYEAFLINLKTLAQDLAKLVVRDGEGATKFITLRVKSLQSRNTARMVAESIARSPLVKTALYGKDANWGRILCAIGYTPGLMQYWARAPEAETKPNPIPANISVAFIPADGSEAMHLVVKGQPQEVDEVRASEILEMEDLEIAVDLGDEGTPSPVGAGEEVYWTCDLSHEYVTINGDYRT